MTEGLKAASKIKCDKGKQPLRRGGFTAPATSPDSGEARTADKPKTRRKHLPSPLRGRGTAASAVVDEVAKNSIST